MHGSAAAAPLRPHWAALLRLLDTALELDAGRRERWLAQLRGADAALRPALRELLAERAPLERSGFLEPAQALRGGDRVGPWTLQRELGTGGTARVWLATRCDGSTPQQAALKLPQRSRRGALDGFLHEQQIVARLAHPAVCTVLEAGSAGRLPWLALEVVDGTPITQHARALGAAQRLALFLQLLDAVAHLHRCGIVHADLKPANVLVEHAGRVRLIDFGAAVQLDAGSPARAGADRGGRWLTPGCAAPEQLAGQPLTAATDVYALGILLYELLSGRRPYRLDRPCAAQLQTRLAALPAPSRVAPDRAARRLLAGGLDAIVLRASSAEPGQRPASAAELALDLGRHLGGCAPRSAYLPMRNLAPTRPHREFP